jgi:hypothetical protein
MDWTIYVHIIIVLIGQCAYIAHSDLSLQIFTTNLIGLGYGLILYIIFLIILYIVTHIVEFIQIKLFF